jgi:putative membrane protein
VRDTVGPSSESLSERTPLIKAGVRFDQRRTAKDVASMGLGGMVEVGLPQVIAHEISRSIFRFRRQGCLEIVGPAGFNSMTALVQAMTEQLGSMERM